MNQTRLSVNRRLIKARVGHPMVLRLGCGIYPGQKILPILTPPPLHRLRRLHPSLTTLPLPRRRLLPLPPPLPNSLPLPSPPLLPNRVPLLPELRPSRRLPPPALNLVVCSKSQAHLTLFPPPRFSCAPH